MERKIIGMLGAGMIALATFCPLVKVSSLEKINFYSMSSGGANGIILVLLGILTCYLFYKEYIVVVRVLSAITGLLALKNLMFIVSNVKNTDNGLFISFENNPIILLKSLGMELTSLSYGGIMLIGGVFLIIITAFTMRKRLEMNLWSF
ncbi:hypothetical protein [Fusobacterium sp.]|uniref:hypothetical protein n=1 Tax=Fusobacterium sp. TaxID=68766 RepID=UPI0028FFF0E9|nr:hypothetical protein [Fusobacterium sp.]MDU1911783.1 hypothetical protein [Fusobacterium sp.]